MKNLARSASFHSAESIAPSTPRSQHSDRMNLLLGMILRKRMTVHGFIVFDDFGHLYPAFASQMAEWVKAGKAQNRE